MALAQYALDGATVAHDLEVMLRSVAESLRRDEEPDQLMFASLSPSLQRLTILVGGVLEDEAMVREATRRLFDV